MLSLEVVMPKSTDTEIKNAYPLHNGITTYDRGGQFIVDMESDFFEIGDVVELDNDDGSICPKFKKSNGEDFIDGSHSVFIEWERLSTYTKPAKPLCENCITTVGFNKTCPQCRTGPLSNDPLVNPKKAAGAVKAPMHTLPTLAMIQMANVMAGGAYKYGFHNFRESKIDAQTYIGAINRHFLKWQDGVDFDKESGQHELAHVMACCAILIDAHFTDGLVDNRSKTGLVENMLKASEESFNTFVKEQEAE